MKNLSILSKLVFIIFNIITIYYFIRGFLYPVETNFWLVHYGFPIIMMEFFSVFILFIIPEIKRRKDIKTIIGLVIVISFAFIISYIFYNYKIFIFFILTALIKFFLINSAENFEKEAKLYVSIALALIFGAFLALLFSGIGNNFPNQQELLKNKIIETGTRNGGSIKGEIVDNPAYIATWGVLYYIILTILQTFNLIKFQKPIKEPDSDDLIKELRK